MEESCVKKLKKLNVLMYELNANGISFCILQGYINSENGLFKDVKGAASWN